MSQPGIRLSLHTLVPVLLATVSPLAAPASAADGPAGSVEHGRYLVMIAGCNDCHTPNWFVEGDKVPLDDWLTGTPVGFRGPWGTTYPSNLRILVHDIGEDAWVAMLQTRTDRPPMPWGSVNAMNESDLRDIYRYIRSLGNGGVRAPLAVPPGEEPETPYIVFEPVHTERLQMPAPAATGTH